MAADPQRTAPTRDASDALETQNASKNPSAKQFEEQARPGPPPASATRAPLFRLIPQLKDTASKVVSVLSGEGIVRYQSEPVKGLLGFDSDQLVGEPLEVVLRPRSKEPLRESLAQMGRQEAKFDQWRFQFRTASGDSLWLEGMASNFLHDPRLGGVMVYWRELVGAS
jgi:PAS domain S-box-containing protein